MSWESGCTVVNRLTKPPSNDHSCCNLERTNANSSGVHATESSPYKVKDDKVLTCQGPVVVVVCSSFGRESVILQPGEHVTRCENGGENTDLALRVTLILFNK
jgi:hypothetical protein